MHARERGADGALLEVVDCVIYSKKLALLALHPHIPTPWGCTSLCSRWRCSNRSELQRITALSERSQTLRRAALREDRLLVFCAGGTEEVFTQCSQNLDHQLPVASRDRRARAAWPNAWEFPRFRLNACLPCSLRPFRLQVSQSPAGVPVRYRRAMEIAAK